VKAGGNWTLGGRGRTKGGGVLERMANRRKHQEGSAIVTGKQKTNLMEQKKINGK